MLGLWVMIMMCRNPNKSSIYNRIVEKSKRLISGGLFVWHLRIKAKGDLIAIVDEFRSSLARFWGCMTLLVETGKDNSLAKNEKLWHTLYKTLTLIWKMPQFNLMELLHMLSNKLGFKIWLSATMFSLAKNLIRRSMSTQCLPANLNVISKKCQQVILVKLEKKVSIFQVVRRPEWALQELYMLILISFWWMIQSQPLTPMFVSKSSCKYSKISSKIEPES